MGTQTICVVIFEEYSEITNSIIVSAYKFWYESNWKIERLLIDSLNKTMFCDIILRKFERAAENCEVDYL